MARIDLIMETLCVIDLFSGAGGFSLGAQLAGFSPILSVELDADLSSSYVDNFPSSKLLRTDISQLNPFDAIKLIAKEPWQISGIIGGPPCQGFSVMGKRNASDPRNRLVTHFFRFIRAIRPMFFVMENVPGILTSPFKEGLEHELASLRDIYSIIGPLKVDSATFGAATCRKRVLVIGCDGTRMKAIEPSDLKALECEPTTVRQAIEDLPPPSCVFSSTATEAYANYPRRNGKILSAYAKHARMAPPDKLASPQVRRLHQRRQISGFQPTLHAEEVSARFSRLVPGEVDPISRYPRLKWDAPCPTLRAGTGKERGSYQAGRPIHPEEDRVITVREAARLQGFPDWFQFHPAKWHSFRMIGNSVSPYLASAVLGLLGSKMS